MTLLAEIGDKMPTVLGTLIGSVILTAIVVGIARDRLWIAVCFSPVFVFWNWVQYAELQEPGFSPLIWNEMEISWIVGRYFAINTPPFIGALVLWKLHAKRTSGVSRNKTALANP